MLYPTELPGRDSHFNRRRMKQSDSLVQIFCKPPIAGEVKTRLMPELGERGALGLYERLLNAVVEHTAGLPCVEIWTSQVHPYFDRFDRPLHVQQGVDLGAKMAHALQQGLQTHDQVILIGSDVPPIDAAYLHFAMTELATHDVVLAPAVDGGYGLVGVRGQVPDIFSDVAWSTDTVFDDTCRHLNRLELGYALLPEVWDVDRPEDLVRYYNLRDAC